MAPTRRRVLNSTDSEEETAGSEDISDDTDYNGGSANKRKTTRAKEPSRSKRQKVTDDSGDDGSPQPSTSGITNSVQVNNGEGESSGEETPDSDYLPIDDSSRNKRKNAQPPKGRPPKRVSPRKKKKDPNYSINNAKSQNGKQLNSMNSSNKLSRLSQLSKDSGALDLKNVETLAQKCVYFLLIEDQKKYAIRRKAIVTNVFKDEAYSPKLYQAVILKANSILMKTFGMELMELETQKDSYLLINILKRELGIDEYVELSKTKHHQHGLILYLLTVIFMNNNCITEDELAKALQPLKLDLLSKKPHPVFGDIKNYITKELVKQMYLSYECISKEPLQYEIKWGLRAKEEVDKKDLLAFACKILDDTTPESWILQYKDAEESAGIQPT